MPKYTLKINILNLKNNNIKNLTYLKFISIKNEKRKRK